MELVLMEYLIGVVLAAVVCAFAMLAGFDRDRVFYPMMLVVVATYYILFAAMGNSTAALTIESRPAGVFLLLAVAGFKKNLWLVAAALVGHGGLRFVSWCVHSQSGCAALVARLLSVFRRSRRVFMAVLLKRRSGVPLTETRITAAVRFSVDARQPL